jgi:gluconate 2-dehydrogenase alpha chain
MAKTMKPVDAVCVGVGWAGSIMARELTKAGLTVVGLERGAFRTPGENFVLPTVRDELKYRLRLDAMLDTATETITMRHEPDEVALPMRRWETYAMGDGLGGNGLHWNGITWRFSPSEFVLRSHLTQRYGKNAIPAEMTVQDWGVTYDELEPYYDKFEKLCGVSGKAGNLRGQIIDGGNPFEGATRQRLPEPAAGHVARRRHLHQRRKEPGLSPIPDAGLQFERALHQS